MANFDWREAEREERTVFDRNPHFDLGKDAWQAFLEVLGEYLRRYRDSEHAAAIRDAFSNFLQRIRAEDNSRKPAARTCRVFISHQRRDAAYAETIAMCACDADTADYLLPGQCLASTRELEDWLQDEKRGSGCSSLDPAPVWKGPPVDGLPN
jgi:hypothetical protein